MELEPDNASHHSAYAESLVLMQFGKVSDTAEAALNAALRLDPQDVRASFLLGRYRQQHGDAEGAITIWLELLANAGPRDNWYNDVHQQVVSLAAKEAIDISARLPEPRIAGTLGNPSPEQVEAVQNMSEVDRRAMIEGMVANLDARLRDNPDDLEGWLRLIQSRRVLGQADLADDALTRAQAVFGNDPDALAQLAALAIAHEVK